MRRSRRPRARTHARSSLALIAWFCLASPAIIAQWEDYYGSSDPGEVSADLAANAEKLAKHFESVSGDDWQRTGFRSDGAAFTIETFARYLVHDPAHHFRDVLNGFDQIRS